MINDGKSKYPWNYSKGYLHDKWKSANKIMQDPDTGFKNLLEK